MERSTSRRWFLTSLILCLMFLSVACKIDNQTRVHPEMPAVIVESDKLVPEPPAKINSVQVKTRIKDIASTSSCASYFWKDRGRAPRAYMRGMALAYAKAICNIHTPEVSVVAGAVTADTVRDGLAWYDDIFKAAGMSNSRDGQDTLMHTYTLLIGLGMRESSGRYCLGRDMSADFNTADSAEAGLFQASWGARRVHPSLPPMLEDYMNGTKSCYLETFSPGITCADHHAVNWGTGTGAVYQRIAKTCPAFAVEYSAVLLRRTAGSRGEFGPMRRKQVELKIECRDMLSEVRKVVEADLRICASLQ